MMVQTLSLDEIAHVIALATAPAFLLGGIVAFLSLLTGRMARIVDRVRALDEIDDQDQRRVHLKADMPRLRRRAKLIHASMSPSILSAVVMPGWHHEMGGTNPRCLEMMTSWAVGGNVFAQNVRCTSVEVV